MIKHLKYVTVVVALFYITHTNVEKNNYNG